MASFSYELAVQGFAVIPGLFDEATLDRLGESIRAADATTQQGRARRRGGGLFAIRNLLDNPVVAEWAMAPELRGRISDLLGGEAFPVRGIFFDKPPGANWLVPTHQDLVIAVKEKRENAPGFRAWSQKEGVWHVLPPVAVLEGMLTARIHLDSCDAGNGALQVIPGSHRHGRLTDAQIDEWKSSHTPVTVAANRGDILLMRPLLLHASSASHGADIRPRRVVHLEYAAHDLPEGLEWHERFSRHREGIIPLDETEGGP